MQTFLPFSDYEQVAQTLDNKRLNKQNSRGLSNPKNIIWRFRVWGMAQSSSSTYVEKV